jgi:CRP/FNR family transcriptional regulator, cyclic AMP receptor protein
MHSRYAIEPAENFHSCTLCTENCFCRLPTAEVEAFEKIKSTRKYPAGATLYVEGQACRGIYVLCKGRVRLSVRSSEGQPLVLTISKPGEVLGLKASLSDTPHTTTAETIEACHLAFAKQAEFLLLLRQHGFACLHATTLLTTHPTEREPDRSFAMQYAR